MDQRQSFKERMKQIASLFKKHLNFYRGLYRDPAVPRPAKVLLWLAIGYTLLPFDLIPDFIPILGQLDDVVIIPLLVCFAVKLIPKAVYEKHRQEFLNF